MKSFGRILTALFCFGALAVFGQEDNVSVAVGGMTISEVPFRIESIRTANNKFVSVEAVSESQVRFLGWRSARPMSMCSARPARPRSFR